MNIGEITKRTAGRTELFLKKHGPVILTSAGVAGFVATTYLTGRAVLKSQEKIAKLKARQEQITSHELDEVYTKKDQAQEVGDLWVHEGIEILKDFAPAIVTGSVSIFCIVASHGMMRNKQAALAAAYTALDTGFRAYRKRVEDEIGPERELQLYRAGRLLEREEGADPALPCEYDYSDILPSPYAKFFDEMSPNWSKTPEYNLFFLRSQENYANDRLKIHGFVFLNEVYESLGLPRSQAGQIVGWKLDGDGDKYISFGIYDIWDESSRAFVNGVESAILLDFNVDGPITI
jgi:Family of unknown function (DUF6353)